MTAPLGALAHLSGRSTLRWLGLMSGTSCDGIDAALVEVEERAGALPRARVVGGAVEPFRREVEEALLAALESGAPVEDAALWDSRLGRHFADAALGLERRFGPADAIALSGHTFAHLPNAEPRATLQLGSPAIVAARTGRMVVAGFRAADVALGGEGAPLVPAADRILFGEAERDVAVLNLGGISNLTWLPRGFGEPRASDSGPGNLVLNAVVRAARGAPFDRDGCIAARGRPHRALAERWLEERFFGGELRSTGREEFGERWVAAHAAELGELTLEDRLATLVLWIARAVALVLARVAGGASRAGARTRLLVGGGGAHHRELIGAIGAEIGLEPEILTREGHGVEADLREAAAFALLGNEWLRGRPGSFPGTTGAREAGPLGSLWLPGGCFGPSEDLE